jgi:hypothetical protein
MTTMRLLSFCALLAAFAACSNPASRESANPGVAPSGGLGTLNAPYYQGADPNFPRGGSGSRGGS